MNFKTTIVLLALLAIAVPAAILLPRYITPTDEARQTETMLFPGFKADAAARMEIRKGTLHVICEKKDGSWFLVKPLHDRADETRVLNAISACAGLRHRGIVKSAAEIEPAKYGLDKPRAEISFSDDQTTHTLLIGSVYDAPLDANSSKSIYVQIKGSNTIYCVGDEELLRDIDRKVEDFRSREILDIFPHRVSKIEITCPAGTLVLAGKKDDWHIEQPVADAADAAKVTAIFKTINETEKQDFIADNTTDFAPYGLDKPAAGVAFFTDDSTPTRLLIGNAVDTEADSDALAAFGGQAGKVYARIDGHKSVFTLNASAVEKLILKLPDIRSRKLADLAADRAASVRLSKGKSTIALVKAETWTMTQPRQVPADAAAIDALLKAIEESSIIDWIDQPGDLAQYGLDDPVRVAVAWAKGNTETNEQSTFELHVGRKDGDLCYAKLPGKPFVVMVPATLAETAAADQLAFRSKRMIDFVKSQCRRLTITRKDGTVFAAAKTSRDDEVPERWAISKPVAGQGEAAEIYRLLYNLSSFDAEKIVAETADLGQYGLDDPEITVSAVVKGAQDTEKTWTARIAGKTDRGIFAGVDGLGLVFTIPESYFKNLTANLLSLTVMQFDARNAVSLTIQHGGERIVCRRTDPKADWLIVEPAGHDADSAKINMIIDRLRLLRARRYIEYTPKSLAPYGLEPPAAVLTVKVLDDQDKVLSIGRKNEDGTAFAVAADATPVFILYKEDLELIDATQDDLLLKDEDAQPQDEAVDADE